MTVADSSAVAVTDADAVMLEAVLAGDTARARWPLQLALLPVPLRGVRLDDDPARRGDTDSVTIGRAVVCSAGWATTYMRVPSPASQRVGTGLAPGGGTRQWKA